MWFRRLFFSTSEQSMNELKKILDIQVCSCVKVDFNGLQDDSWKSSGANREKMCLYLFIVNYECFLLGYLLSAGMNKASSFYKG